MDAVYAYETYGPKYLPQDEHKAVSKLQGSGVDGFLTIALPDKTKQRVYNPGYSQIAPVGYCRSRVDEAGARG